MPLDEFGREIPAAFRHQHPPVEPETPTPRKQQQQQQPIDDAVIPPPSSSAVDANSTNFNNNNNYRPPQVDSRTLKYPAFAYVNVPLKCEYLFKEEQQQQPDKQHDTETTTVTYEEYRKSYCLNYVRTFFNEHMDDSWFRRRYSSLLRYQDLQNERERATREATELKENMQDLILTGAKHQAPLGHLFSFQRDNSRMAIVVSDIPTHLTDEQLLLAIETTSKQQPPPPVDGSNKLQLYHVTAHKTPPYRNRSVIVVGAKSILESMCRTTETANFNFECSTDPYNRTGIDADGHGGATADGRRVPMRTVTVKIDPLLTVKPTVLSATLSTPSRFEADLEKATQLAVLLDERNKIPPDCNLQASLNHHFADHQQEQHYTTVEQRLDYAVAYLRRVHLRNFYHQPDISHTFAEMVMAPLYVRMKVVEENLDDGEDLLVKQLEDGLNRALDGGNESSVDEDVLRQEAEAIERDIRLTEEQWVRDHSIAHAKGRARCSFHFCNKLFQDDNYLQKHLFKKHLEYLNAEQAKCHDKSMMKAWDEAVTRPVPEIVVDCGGKFGWVATPLLTGGVPDVEDPEPRLWKAEEERQAAMQRRRDDVRQHHQQQQQQYHQQKVKRSFVDVDDMQEEKVELTFDPAVAVIPPKKKKKKRKLL